MELSKKIIEKLFSRAGFVGAADEQKESAGDFPVQTCFHSCGAGGLIPPREPVLAEDEELVAVVGRGRGSPAEEFRSE